MIRKWLIKLLTKQTDESSEDDIIGGYPFVAMHSVSRNGGREDSLDSSGMKFTIYTAVGGHIMETAHFSESRDEYEYKLYMIRDDEDFAKQVAQAVMMETLSH